jgi:purine/pyrimidine-nucleoside phosphorylase
MAWMRGDLARSAAMTLTHNTYFDHAVQSIGFERDGARQSVGVMAGGEYHFGTDAPERMTVVSGELMVQLPGSTEWVSYTDGAAFEVPGSSGFDLKVAAPTAYLCEYL